MDKDLILGALTQQPVTIATLSSLTGLDSDQIAKQCYQMVKNGEIKRAKVANPAAGKKGAAPTVYGYFLDESSCAIEEASTPPADPPALAQAINLDGERLERVAHVLRGCGLSALQDVTGSDDLQSATAALAGAYQMLLAKTDDLVAKNTSLNNRLSNIRSSLDLIRTDRDKMIMENAGLVELIHTLKLENDTLQTRIAALEGNLELPACGPTPSLGWLAIVPGKTYGSEVEARLAATAYCTDETEVEQYGESIAVAKIIAIAEPIVAVKWREAA